MFRFWVFRLVLSAVGSRFCPVVWEILNSFYVSHFQFPPPPPRFTATSIIKRFMCFSWQDTFFLGGGGLKYVTQDSNGTRRFPDVISWVMAYFPLLAPPHQQWFVGRPFWKGCMRWGNRYAAGTETLSMAVKVIHLWKVISLEDLYCTHIPPEIAKPPASLLEYFIDIELPCCLKCDTCTRSSCYYILNTTLWD